MGVAGQRKQLFMSHAWSKDTHDRCTHARTKRLSGALRAAGWTTWFDEDDMFGNIDAAMAAGIDGADVVLVCLTRAYCTKVSAAASDMRTRDNCLKEWSYAHNRQKLMVAIVMEPCMRSPADWPPGVVAMHLGGLLYVDASGDDVDDYALQICRMLEKLGVSKPRVPFRRTPRHPMTYRPPPLLPPQARVEAQARVRAVALKAFGST